MNYRVYLGEDTTQYVNVECDHMEEEETEAGDIICRFVDAEDNTVAMFCLDSVAGLVRSLD